MAACLAPQGIGLFDHPRWAEPFREQLRANAERLAREAGIAVEYIRRHKAFRKEGRIQAILAERGTQPGLVHIFSAMEPCTAFSPWFDKAKQRALLKPDSGKCLHYYFYFIDEDFGLCYLRVPTWAPFRLQAYFNGHSWLAQQLRKEAITFAMADNAFLHIAEPRRAQELADGLAARTLHQHLDRWAEHFCPVVNHFHGGYHWSFMQVEYATDVVFRQQAVFQPLYEAIVRTAVHVLKAEHVAMFLGHKLHGRFQDELGDDFSTRIQGTRIRHHMGPARETLIKCHPGIRSARLPRGVALGRLRFQALGVPETAGPSLARTGNAINQRFPSIKLYDKARLIARVECTTNDVAFFKHHRYVEPRTGQRVFKLAALRKSIYSLNDLRGLMHAANARYLAFMACLDNPDAGHSAIAKIAAPVKHNGRSSRGFDLFLEPDYRLSLTLARAEWAISGPRASDLRAHINGLSPGRASYILKPLRTHGLIKKVANRYKYYLTALGRRALTTTLVIREYFVQPTLVRQAL